MCIHRYSVNLSLFLLFNLFVQSPEGKAYSKKDLTLVLTLTELLVIVTKPFTMQVPWNFRFGIVILGDSAVGKSSLLHRFTEGTFDESRQSPLGIDFKVLNMNFDPDVVIKLLLWDTAGQERFR